MYMFKLLSVIFLIVWAWGLPIRYLCLRFLSNRYDLLSRPNSYVLAHKYQWTTPEVWRESFETLASLTLKVILFYTPAATLVTVLWFLFEPYRLILSIVGCILLFVSLVFLMIKSANVHRRFCPKGWALISHSDGKTRGIYVL